MTAVSPRRCFVYGCLLLAAHLLSVGHARAQVAGLPPSWSDLVERWNESGENALSYEEVEELYEQFSTHPVCLNDTLGAGLRQFFFITPFQCDALRAYIEQRGELLSVQELLLVPGFDAAAVALLTPVVTVCRSERPSSFAWSDLWRNAHHSLVVGASGTVERSRGYEEEIYEGDPYRLYWRYRYRAGKHVQLQLSGDKDAGEALFAGSQRQGFDHYGFHLMLSDIGILKRLIVGDYNLQFGQGTTLWTGFAPYTVLGGVGFRAARGIAPASAYLEYSYLTGMAATVTPVKPLEITLFCAYTPLDATVNRSLSDSLRDGLPLVQSIYLSGYHRTATEIAKRHQLNELLYGAQVTYRRTNWKVGLTGYRMSMDKFIQPGKYRYNYYYFTGHENSNVGVDAAYRHGNFLTYGECSLSQNRHKAAMAGLDWMYAPSSLIGAVVYHYDAWYWNLHSDALSVGGYTRNEQGLMLTARTPLPAHIRSEASLAWCRFPEMRSTAYGPSHALDTRLRLSKELFARFSVSILYRFRRQDANVKEAGEYLLFPSLRHQWQTDLHYDVVNWHYGVRLSVADYRLQEEHYRGFLVHGDVQWVPSTVPVSLAVRMSAFDVEDYDARIYAVENGLAFDNSGVFFNHRGLRFYTVIHYDMNRWLALAAKYSLSRYLDDSLFGSGYDALGTNHRQQWYLQMRLKF